MPIKLSDREIKLAVIEFLLKKGRWGAHYFSLETLVNWFSKKTPNDGKRLRNCLKSLSSEGFILLHKKGKTISLNPTKTKEIRSLLSQ